MGALLSRQPEAASDVASASTTADTIIPFRYLDDQIFLKQVVLVFTYRFDDVLDLEKLRESLRNLLHRDDWRQLGARVRVNESGLHEYCIPQQFDEARPAFAWSESHFTQQDISDHPLGRRFPCATPDGLQPQFFDDAANLLPLVQPEDKPRRIEDWTSTDAPLLSFHLVAFKDATLVTVSWCHAFMDGSAVACLMEAWTSTLAGAGELVSPVLPLKQDPVKSLASNGATAPADSYVLYPQKLSGSSFVQFAFRQVWEALWYPKTETRMICLPAKFVATLQSRAHEHTDGFVSEGDVVSAWVTRITTSALSTPSPTPVGMANVFDARQLVDDTILPSHAAYLGNMSIQYLTYPSAGDLAGENLGATARRIRKALEEQRTAKQFEAYLAAHREASAAGRVPLFGPDSMVMVNISNWHKARFYQYDFSAALAQSAAVGAAKGEQVKGKPSYISVTGHETLPISSRNVGCLIGKDADGNWWMNWTMRKSAWPAFVDLATSTI